MCTVAETEEETSAWKVLRPPPGLHHFESGSAATDCDAAGSRDQVELSVDADGIARLLAPDGRPASPQPVRRVPADASVSPRPQLRMRSPARGSESAALSPPPRTRLASPSRAISYNGTDGISLAEHIRLAAASGAARVVIDVIGDCVEPDPIEVEAGEVLLRGPSEGAKVRLTVTGLRVTGGSLCLQNLAICATEENRVQSGQLQCSDCIITSRSGCGVLCLQKARVFLTNCEVSNCMRSGIGVNGKNTEIELHRCAVSKNNFSGIGVNHQARSIILSDTRIVDNGYHGLWLNKGVMVRWLGGEISGNRLSAKDGPGILQGWDNS